MRIYLSGKMSGLPDFGFPLFHAAAANLRSLGYAVTNPAELDEMHPGEELTWAEYLKRDIKALVDCTHIALLPNWTDSRGAKLEHHIATELGMTVLFLNDQGEVA
jgi:hypothetical protein